MVDLSWILTVNPEGAARDPRRALALAERVVVLTGRRDILALDALAGALASICDFDQAVAVLDQAVRVAAGTAVADDLRQRQDRYRRRLPPILP